MTSPAALWAPVARAIVVPPQHAVTWQADLPMPAQVASWTCSACALDWVLRAAAIYPSCTRDKAVQMIGYPENINEQFGLMSSDGRALRDVYESFDQPTVQAWLDFDSVYQLARRTTGQMSGARWYHWVALRGTVDGDLWIANSAPGYMGVYDVLSRADFERLGGFSVVWLSP